MTRLNAKNSFGLLNLKNDKNTWINVICGILLVVLIILLIICLVKGKDSFGDTNKEDTIKVFVREGCPFVDRAKSKHKENNDTINGIPIEYIDISDSSAKTHGITGTPSYVWRGNVVPGFHDDDNELYKKLTEDNNNKSTNNDSSKKHIMVGSLQCGFCRQAKNDLDKKQVDYEFIDSSTDRGKKILQRAKVTGIPFIKTTYGEEIHGYDAKKISQLK